MDITGLSTLSIAASTASVHNDIATAVFKMSLDNYEVAGEEMTKMMEHSVTPHLGQNMDVTI